MNLLSCCSRARHSMAMLFILVFISNSILVGGMNTADARQAPPDLSVDIASVNDVGVLTSLVHSLQGLLSQIVTKIEQLTEKSDDIYIPTKPLIVSHPEALLHDVFSGQGNNFAVQNTSPVQSSLCTATFRNPFQWHRPEEFEGMNPLKCLIGNLNLPTNPNPIPNPGVGIDGISDTCISTKISDTEIKTVCNYTGSDQKVNVPAGASSIEVKAWGAAGGEGGAPVNQTAEFEYMGGGGYATGVLPNPSGSYTVVVGQGGIKGASGASPFLSGADMTYGGGGMGGSVKATGVSVVASAQIDSHGSAGSGGGLSGLFRRAFAISSASDAILIAGGGGGEASGGLGAAGAGGGTSGISGGTADECFAPTPGGVATGGIGGSLNEGGAAGTGFSTAPATAGTQFQGGSGSEGTRALNANGGGGGGGGYFGGGGGGANYGCEDSGGGGGSSYGSSVLQGFATVSGINSNTGNTSDPDYITGVGTGVVGGNGGSGLVVVRWTGNFGGNGINTSGSCVDASLVGTTVTTPGVPASSNGGTLHCSGTLTIPTGCTASIQATGHADGVRVGEAGISGGGAVLYVQRQPLDGGSFAVIKTLNSHYNNGTRLNLNEAYTDPGVYRLCEAENNAHSAAQADAGGTLTMTSVDISVGNGGGSLGTNYVASGQNVLGPNSATNQAVIDLGDHGFDPNGADPHIIVSQRNYNANSVDGNTMDASFCGFTKVSKLVFTTTCWASTNASGGTVRSSFDWMAVQPRVGDVVASGQNVMGPNSATNQAVIDLADHGFDVNGVDPHIIVSERNYNANSVNGNTMDASFCGFTKVSKLVFTTTCWASTNASGGTVRSSFDWMAVQPAFDGQNGGSSVSLCENVTAIGTVLNARGVPSSSNGGTHHCSDEMVIPEGCNAEILATGTATGHRTIGSAWIQLQKKNVDGSGSFASVATVHRKYNVNPGTQKLNKTVSAPGIYRVCTAANRYQGPSTVNATAKITMVSAVGNENSVLEGKGIASGQNVSGPNTATNQAVIDLANYGFDINGREPHIIVSERNYNANSVNGNTMDASFCGFTKISKLVFTTTCWASTNSSGGTVQSTFDWLAIQEEDVAQCPSNATGNYPGCVCAGGMSYDMNTNTCSVAPGGVILSTQTITSGVCTNGQNCTASCPAGTSVLSGGVDWVSTNGTCHVSETKPYGNGWMGATSPTNSQTSSCTYKVHAICGVLADGVATQKVSRNCPNGQCDVSCPAGSTVTGGGVDWLSTNGTCHVAESRPKGLTGWQGGTAPTNSQTSSCASAVEAICLMTSRDFAPEIVRGTGVISCPVGKSILGGGVDWVSTNGTCHVSETFPSGNGWQGATSPTNSQTSSCGSAVEAICGVVNETSQYSISEIDSLEPIHGDMCSMQVCDQLGNCEVCTSPPLKLDSSDVCKSADGVCSDFTCHPDDAECQCLTGQDLGKCIQSDRVNCYLTPFDSKCTASENPVCLLDPFTFGCPAINPCSPGAESESAVCPRDGIRYCAANRTDPTCISSIPSCPLVGLPYCNSYQLGADGCPAAPARCLSCVGGYNIDGNQCVPQ